MKNILFTLTLLISFNSFSQRKTKLPPVDITIISQNDTILSGDTISKSKLLNAKLYFNLEVKDDSIYYFGRQSITGSEAKKALQRENIVFIELRLKAKIDEIREQQQKRYEEVEAIQELDDEDYIQKSHTYYYNHDLGSVRANLESWKDSIKERISRKQIILQGVTTFPFNKPEEVVMPALSITTTSPILEIRISFGRVVSKSFPTTPFITRKKMYLFIKE